MKLFKLTSVMFLAAMACAGPAHAAKSCEELKGAIAAKLDGKGVKGYTLTVIGKDEASDGKVVGTCAGGAKKITYVRK
jgi:hypothetical protein